MKNLKKIKRIFVLGKPFKVIFRKPETGELVKDRKQKIFLSGTCSMDLQRMVMADHLAIEETFDTILHEAFHILEGYMRYDSEEKYVARMSSSFAAFLLDNFNMTPKREIL